MAPEEITAAASGRPFRRVAVLLCVLTGVAYLGAGLLLARHGSQAADFGWTAAWQDGQLVVTEVAADGPAAGRLTSGDKVRALRNSRLGRGEANAVVRQLAVRRDGSYTLLVEGRGAVELSVRARPEPAAWQRIAPDLALSLAFCAVALFIGFAKPEDAVARLGCMTMWALGLNALGNALDPSVAFLYGAGLALHFGVNLGTPLYLALAYDFLSRFPPGAPPGSRWARTLFYLWGAALALVWKGWALAIVWRGADFGLAAFLPYETPLEAAAYADMLLFITASAATMAVMARAYWQTRGEPQGQRIKWLAASIVLAIAPVALTTVALFVAAALGATETGGLRALLWLAGFAPLAIPFAFGYAIVKHQVLDINVVIRRSLQYLLARQVLRVAFVLPAAAFLYALVRQRQQPLAEVLFHNWFNLGLCLWLLAAMRFRGPLLEWLDRRFFRAAYSHEEILSSLVEELRQGDSREDISAAVNVQVNAALQPKSFYIFYRDREAAAHTLIFSSGQYLPGQRLAEDSGLLRVMESQHSAVRWDAPDLAQMDDAERAMLAQLGVHLILPMKATAGRLSGLLLLGEKRSEEEYTTTDCKLLQNIAGQVAIVYENLALKERVATERTANRAALARLQEQNVNLVKECPACRVCYDGAEERCPADGAELRLTLPVERVIAQRYRLERVLGQGGMGQVYLARDTRLQRDVALKVLNARLFDDYAARRRFEREAQTSAQLNHPNVVAVYDYGQTHADNPFLVLEYVSGHSLREVLKARGALAPPLLAEIFAPLLEGVRAAHQSGVTHRDLKPENILLTPGEDGRYTVKILDFGLAKLRREAAPDAASMTAPGMVIGTLGYMPLEQLYGDAVTERADIFALGVIAAEALTGYPPFPGRSWTEIVRVMQKNEVALPAETPAAARLNDVLRRCLAPEPQDRWAGVAGLQRELLPALRACPVYSAYATPADADDEPLSTLMESFPDTNLHRPHQTRDGK